MEGIAELIFMALLVVTAMIISAVVKSVRKAMEEDSGRQSEQQREGAATSRTPREELDDFVRVLTGGQPAQRRQPQHRPPAPPPRTPQQESHQRRQADYGDGGIRRPDEGRAPARPSRPPTVKQGVQRAQTVRKPARRVERKSFFDSEAEPKKKPEKKPVNWYDKLPRDERKRAIVLREAFGPPVAMRRGWPDPHQGKGRLNK